MKKRMRYTAGIAMLSAMFLLGGCAMGSATGNKTTQGIAELEKENYQQALELFAQAVQEDEQQMLAYRGLGIAYLGLAQYEDAEQAFEAALECADSRQPENVQDVQLYLATAQYRQGKYDDVIISCGDILDASEEGSAAAYFLRGASYLYEDQREEAASDFDAAVALTPADYDLYLNIYDCYQKLNLSGMGSSYLQSALNIQGEDTEHSYNRGRIYYYLEDYEQAQSQLIGPMEAGYEPAMYLIAKVYLAQEDYSHALDVYQKIQQQFGDSAALFNGYAMCSIASGNYDEALSYISQGLALGESSSEQELYFNEITAYEKKHDFAAAKAKAQEYVQRYPGDEAGQKEWTFLATR